MTSRTNLTGLKPAEDFFFFLSFLLPPILYHFYVFFLPFFKIYFYVLIFVKIPAYLASDLSLFLLPSFLPFLLFYFRFPSFPSFFFLSSPLSLFPTGETTKPGVLKRLELDRVKPINVSSRPVSTRD